MGVPALIVHGRDDQVVPPETSRRLHDLIDGSRLHVFEQCGHWVQLERAEALRQLPASVARTAR